MDWVVWLVQGIVAAKERILGFTLLGIVLGLIGVAIVDPEFFPRLWAVLTERTGMEALRRAMGM